MVVLGAIIALLTLQLPALTPDEALKRSPDGQKKMVVSGHVTSARWPGMAPAAHALADGRYLLYDSYSANLAWVWAPKTKKLAPLGETRLSQTPAGILVVTHADDRATYHDVDPKKPALRALWTEPPDTERVQTWVAGATTSGAPVIVTRTTKGTKMITIRDAGVIEERDIALPAKADVTSADALRGSLLLLIENVSDGGGLEAPVVAVSTLDVETGDVHALGTARGCHTTMTSAIHPYVDVTWADHAPHVRRPGRENGCPVLVDPQSKRLYPTRGSSPF